MRLHTIRVQPWSFAIARNTALALVPADVDVCIRLDFDEVLPDNWRDALERSGPFGGVTWIDYQYSPTFCYRHCVHVHPRYGVWWKGIDHESLEFEDAGTRLIDFKITHHPKPNRQTGVLARLERAARLEPSARTWWYLGREYFYAQKWQDCITALVTFLDLGAWGIERMAAYGMLADCFLSMGERERGVDMAMRGVDAYKCRESYYKVWEMTGEICWRQLAFNYMVPLGTIHARPELWVPFAANMETAGS